MRLKSILAASAFAALALSALADLGKSDLDIKKITRTVAYSLPVFHLNQLPLDTHISTNACAQFIDSLDPTRSYFRQSDIEAFEAQSPTLYKKLRKGDISFAVDAFNTLMERIENRTAFIEQRLEEGFDTTIEEEFLWDRKEADWVGSTEEWNELWRKRIKNEYVARLVTKEVFPVEETESTNAVAKIEQEKTNTLAAANLEGTNEVARAEADGLEDETANMTPEEFIMERYKQYKLTMETFDEEMLLQRYLSAFTTVYDPHSTYMSPSEVEDFNIDMKLSLVGIGAMLRPEDGAAKIVRIIPGGPADKDGRLKPGDKIIKVAQGDDDPVSILHWPLYKSVRLIRGEKNTTVVLTIIPANDSSGTLTKKIDIVRDEVKLEEQAAKSSIEEITTPTGESRRLGVIKLPDFYSDFTATSNKEARKASRDVRRLIDELILADVAGIVLDLRGNLGGSLLEAIETAGLFITSGPIVQVKERNRVQVLPDDDPEIQYDGPLVVLVNRLSASASEILAAAMQDYKRAVIVGDSHTHGKGSVQTLIPLGDGKGKLKMTTAGYYRINGGSTQLKGVIPDINIPSFYDVMDLGEDTLEYALPWNQITRAMYRTHHGLGEQIPLLAENSQKRLAENDEFKHYLSKRDRLEKRYETKTVSLSLSKRITEAKTEKELDDIQDEMMDQEESEDRPDLVLRETLNILSDLIDLDAPRTAKADAAHASLAP